MFRVRLPVVPRFPDIALALSEAPHKIEYVGARPFLTINLPALLWNVAKVGGR